MGNHRINLLKNHPDAIGKCERSIIHYKDKFVKYIKTLETLKHKTDQRFFAKIFGEMKIWLHLQLENNRVP
jgi:hypothetical protein